MRPCTLRIASAEDIIKATSLDDVLVEHAPWFRTTSNALLLHIKPLVNAGERRALWHYRLRGYRILGTNVQAGRNELDLIVRRGKELTFVEVKQRRGGGFGGAVGAVDAEKQRRVRRAAQVWLSRNPQGDDVRVGFEVVAVEEGRLVRIPASLSGDSTWQGDRLSW